MSGIGYQARSVRTTSHQIPSTAVARYTAAPAPTTVTAAKSLQESIRDVLGSAYDTFLQGSYKNDTGVPDLNDVDIVAIRRWTTSSVFTRTIPADPISWVRIFQEVQAALESSHHYRGKTRRGDKSVKVDTNFKADVIPAVRIGDVGQDPIAIYSLREQRERQNFPRVHYANNVAKQERTRGAYKPTVQMFKRWVRNWFAGTKTAPSFYVECLLHGVPDDIFAHDPAASFLLVGHHIVNKVDRNTVVMSVAGDKDIFSASEWARRCLRPFRRVLPTASAGYSTPST